MRQPVLPVGLTVLSPRERQVVQARAAGTPYKVLAADLGIALPTAKTHASRAFVKLGVHTSLEAVRILFLERAAL